MARTKNYIEDEVIERAMHLFWRYGYEKTSTRMLEQAMGINQFSIYSSFGNKQGLFFKSIKCYEKKLKSITDKLKSSNNGLEAIKQYFYDFIKFSKLNSHPQGCMITNAANELGEKADPLVKNEIIRFSGEIRSLFRSSLKQDENKDDRMLDKHANYLIIAINGLASASKVFTQEQLIDYIETTFENF